MYHKLTPVLIRGCLFHVTAVIWATAGPLSERFLAVCVSSLGCIAAKISQAPHCFASVSATKGSEAECCIAGTASPYSDISQIT